MSSREKSVNYFSMKYCNFLPGEFVNTLNNNNNNVKIDFKNYNNSMKTML